MFVTPPDPPMSPTYQQADVRFVFSSLLAGQSCALIGIGSVGKSNLLLNLTRTDVRRHYLGDQADDLLTVYLDPHARIRLDGEAAHKTGVLWSGYELMTSRLSRALSVTDWLAEDQYGTLEGILEQPWDPDPVRRQSGLRHLENALLTLLQDNDRRRVAFLIDEVRDFGDLPDTFFVSLRALRDQFKGRVMYVTTGRTPVAEALGGDRDVGAFTGLFGDHTHYIRPLDADSAGEVVDRFIARYDHSYHISSSGRDFLTSDLFKLTGGHVGLLRRGFRPAVNYLIEDVTRPLADYLLDHESVRRECQRILDSLTDDEQRVFYDAIVHNRISDLTVWERLFEKHLVKEQGRGADFQMPLLGVYARQVVDR